jgi:hypothetical protein
MITKILLDADSLLYRCGFAADSEDVANALQNLKSQIQKIKEALSCEDMDIFIKGKGNFRDEISQTTVYKGTRVSTVPTHYRALREYIINVHKAKEVDGMEADDAASVELWKNRDPDSGVILAAMDKDLWNTPGWHFNYDPRKWRADYVSLFDANRNFIKQLLSGDRTDNVPGLPYFAESITLTYGDAFKGRVGEKKAQAFVDACETNREALTRTWNAYKWYGEQESWTFDTSLEYFVEQGRLLWMTRELNPDGTPVLWEAPEFIFFQGT